MFKNIKNLKADINIKIVRETQRILREIKIERERALYVSMLLRTMVEHLKFYNTNIKQKKTLNENMKKV